MKTLVLCLSVLCFYSCKKEDMAATHPEYSFVRLNEPGFTISDCATDIDECMPIYELDDVKFQLITDFPNTVAPSGINIMAAIPCTGISWQVDDIYEMLFADNLIIDGISNTSDGFLKIKTAIDFAAQARVDDWVYLTGSGVYKGFHKITAYEFVGGGGVWLTLDIKTNIDASVGSEISLITNTLIVADSSTLIPINSEFAGTQYAWQFNKPMNSLNANVDEYIPQTNYNVGDCFSFCVWKLSLSGGGTLVPTITSGLYLGSTNCFEVVDNICFTTKLEYGCNEDAFGFYGQGFFNSIRLPMYLSRPNYDSEEKGYQKSNGQFVKLAERVNKTFELKTDYMPSEWHDRLRVALSCDTIHVTNENENLTAVSIYKKDEYEVDWDSEIDFPLAKGKAKVFKGLFRKSVNSNCV